MYTFDSNGSRGQRVCVCGGGGGGGVRLPKVQMKDRGGGVAEILLRW